MTWYLLRLIPARSDFAYTMTEEERLTMARHSAYWREHLEQGAALIFSPVADPAGPWGLCIVQAPDLATAQALTGSDPAVHEGVGHYEMLELLSPVLADGSR